MEFLEPLARPALAQMGIPEGWNFGRADKVRFAELDILGHANNGVYLTWLETARIAYFDWLDLPRGEQHNLRLVLVGTTLNFRAPVDARVSYVTCVRTKSVGNTSFTTEYGIFVEGQQTTSGEITMVCVENDVKTKRAVPDDFRAKLLADGAADLRA